MCVSRGDMCMGRGDICVSRGEIMYAWAVVVCAHGQGWYVRMSSGGMCMSRSEVCPSMLHSNLHWGLYVYILGKCECWWLVWLWVCVCGWSALLQIGLTNLSLDLIVVCEGNYSSPLDLHSSSEVRKLTTIITMNSERHVKVSKHIHIGIIHTRIHYYILLRGWVKQDQD